jgi:hypothetical protein
MSERRSYRIRIVNFLGHKSEVICYESLLASVERVADLLRNDLSNVSVKVEPLF